MPRQSETIKYIHDNAQSTPWDRRATRLYYKHVATKSSANYQKVAEVINGDEETSDYVLDTNFITAHAVDDCVWKALSQKRLTFTRGVWQELGAWRSMPFHNRDLVSHFEQAKRQNSNTVLFDEDAPWGIPGRFRNWYVNVLLQRKRRAVSLVEEFVDANQREPTTDERNRLFQTGGIDRDFHIFRKGHDEISTGGNFATDEELVSTAAMIALSAGRSVTILTRDHDVLEQFYLLTGLLTNHYQATLFAERYANHTEDFVTRPMPSSPELNAYFEVDQSLLVAKPVPPDEFLPWVLPEEYTPVGLRCVLFGGAGDALTTTVLSFVGETAMVKLVEAKGLSGGLNTNLLGGKNCHVTGFPKGIDDPRSFVAVAADRLMSSTDPDMKFPRLDLAHATTHFEVITAPNPPDVGA